MMPHCWAQYNDVRCQTPSPTSPAAALQAGWTVLQVSLTPRSAYPASFGTTLLVPICPEHNDSDMVDTALWAFGLHTPIWDTAIPALDGRPIHIERDCPECRRMVESQWTLSDPLPAGWHAAYTANTNSSRNIGYVTLACPEHTYALWDFSLGL
jgi:hypothetical protein